MRIQRIKQYPLVSIQNTYPQILGPSRLPSQLRKLMQHFAFRRVQRANERAIELHKRGLIALQQLAQRLFPGIETACQTARQAFLLHERSQMLMPAENVANLESKFCKQARHQRVDDRKSRSRQNRWHTPEKSVVNHLSLRHVGNFGGASDICGSRQQRVLNDRPQQHVWRENLGSFLDCRLQFCQRKRRATCRKFAVAHTKWLPTSVHIVKKQSGLAANFNLRVISSLIQLSRPRYERSAQYFSLIQRATVNARG